MVSFDMMSYAVDSGEIGQAYYIPDFISEYEEEYILREIHNSPKPKWKSLENRRLQVWGGDLTHSNKLLAQTLPPFLTKYPDIIGRLQSTGAFSTSKHRAPNHVIVNEYLPFQGIMPHEDGPSYHPVVATISLGSHTVFNYYRYKLDTPPITPSTQANPERNIDGGGRAIDMSHPVLRLLLEPRSLVITTGELYMNHLHGIDPVAEDVFLPAILPDSAIDISGSNTPDAESSPGVRIANWRTVKDPKMRKVVVNGGTLSRGDRISLTCRDVENVVSVKSFR